MSQKWITKKGRDGENRHIPINESSRVRERELKIPKLDSIMGEKEKERVEKEKKKMIQLEKILRKNGTSIEKLKRRLASKARLKTNNEVDAPDALLVIAFFDDDEKLVFETDYNYYECSNCSYEWSPDIFAFEFMTYLHKETTLARLINGEVGYFHSEFENFLDDLYTWLTDYHKELMD